MRFIIKRQYKFNFQTSHYLKKIIIYKKLNIKNLKSTKYLIKIKTN